MQGKNRLLIVDDERDICEILKELGEYCGYEVTTTLSGDEFCRVYPEIKPNFIIIDLNIPDKDGIELLRFLAEEECKVPIVLESGQDDKVISSATKLGRAFGLNIVEYFEKPVKVKEIIKILQKNNTEPCIVTPDSLKEAIDGKCLVLHYQPKVSFKTKKVVGLEALVRVQFPEGAIIEPNKFISMAEKTNLIHPLSQLIINDAFDQFEILVKKNPEISLSVNLSPKILDNLSIPDKLLTKAKAKNINPKQICLEITETALLSQYKIVADIMTRFRIKGFTISIDDFGTGYSSLIELHRLPFNEIKIDMSFVLELMTDLEARKITQSVIHLGHDLGLYVTAEGIESKEIWGVLEAQGCDIAQGFYVSPPLGFKEIQEWLEIHKEGFSDGLHKK